MSIYYLDTSVAIRIVMGESPAAAQWFDGLNRQDPGSVISSRILRTEMIRTLRRIGQPIERAAELLDSVLMISVDNQVLTTAESIQSPLKSLDAIHVGSAIACGLPDIIICTHDRQMRNVAADIGFDVFDPVTDDPHQK